MKKYALIVAGGSGNRMEADIPKQFIEINNKPILMHTIECFYSYDNTISILLVLPKTQILYWKELCSQFNFNITIQIIEGGNTRFQSVKNGLSAIDNEGIVAIHDGVRPFVNSQIIEDNFATALSKGSALTVVNLKESIRTNNKSLDRSKYKQVQTPQTFNISDIKEAYNQPELNSFTDDASVFEANGGEIHLVEGNYKNIKITTPEDILIAEAYAKL